MRPHLLSAALLALCLAAVPACKKDEAANAPATATAPGSDTPAQSAPGAAKASYTPSELWAAQDGLTHMKRMEKFRGGVTLVATVAKVHQPEAAEYELETDAGEGRTFVIRFHDFGAAAKARPVAAGDEITATSCRLTNPEGQRIAIVACELQ